MKTRSILFCLGFGLLLTFFQNCGKAGFEVESSPERSSKSPTPASGNGGYEDGNDQNSTGQVFALMDANDKTSQFDQYLKLSTVDGIAIRLSWDSIETSNGVYDWTSINQAFTSAVSNKKKVTVHILSSIYGKTPNWVYTAGAASYTYGRFGTSSTNTDPVPWDNQYKIHWQSFLSGLYDHLNSLGYLDSLEFISVGSPVPEMSLIGCNSVAGTKYIDIKYTNNMPTGGTIPYDRSKYLQAWKEFVSVTYNLFPTKKILLPAPVAHICFGDNDGGSFYKEVFDYAKSLSSTQFYHYATDLMASGLSGSSRLDQIPISPIDILSEAPVGLQYTWSYTDSVNGNGTKLGGTFDQATCGKGIKTLKGKYFEVYKPDLLNADPSIQNAIQAIHNPTLCN